MTSWTYEFHDAGGYDCMSSSFDICENGEFRFKLDQSDFGQKSCEDYAVHIPACEALAKRIVDGLNAAGDGGRDG